MNQSSDAAEQIVRLSLEGFEVAAKIRGTGAKNVATVDLLPTDTLGLYGKYIYQITIKDIDGEVEIPNQGIFYIFHNVNESFLK